MEKRKSGEDFTSGASVFIVTNFIVFLASYLVRKHTLEVLGKWIYTVSSF